MLNLSRLFFTTTEGKKCLLSELNISQAQKSHISSAKQEIRDCLRSGIPKIMIADGHAGVPKPRFFTQGSWVYKTLNSPAKLGQQADVDDGCYLPLGFISESSAPKIASQFFFDAAETALTPLAEKHQWKIISDKPTCIRVEIAEYAHVDIPLYAIPDTEFNQLVESRSLNFSSVPDLDWDALPSDKVLLAHRKTSWQASDPRPLKEWFLREVSTKGEQFRRTVRYLKAYRDFRWTSGGPSSIVLMVAASHVFNKVDRRDDLALLNTATALPEQLRKGVDNPTAAESLSDRLGKEGIEEAAKAFEYLAHSLRSAIHGSPSSACIKMTEIFGSRFPNDPDRITEVQIEKWDDTEEIAEDRWEFKISGSLSLECDVKQNGYRKFSLWDLIRRKTRINSNKELNFYISRISVAKPYKIFWKVLNKGSEAQRRNCIRGQIFEDPGYQKIVERTSFFW